MKFARPEGVNTKPDIVPIPSARRMAHAAENAEAARISLAPDQIRRLEAAVRPDDVAGARNTVEALRLMNLRTPTPAGCR
jgi:diketogulonate reductase-like aldo/keto reductase